MSTTSDARMTAMWQAHRAYLVDLAFRMLGNIHDAEDVVQDAFGRLLRRGQTDDIGEVRGFLVVVVSRLCLDQLRSARRRHEADHGPVEETCGTQTPAPCAVDPLDRVTLDDTIRSALLVVLEQLTPAERAVFVLHDVFQFPFETVATIVGRTPSACRQLATRARRHIQADARPSRFAVDLADQRRLTERFIAACAGGDLDALLSMLDADAGGDVDLGPGMRPAPPTDGRAAVAANLLRFFGPKSGTVLVSHPSATVPTVLAFRDGRLFSLVRVGVRDDLIHDLHAVVDPAKLAPLARQVERQR